MVDDDVPFRERGGHELGAGRQAHLQHRGRHRTSVPKALPSTERRQFDCPGEHGLAVTDVLRGTHPVGGASPGKGYGGAVRQVPGTASWMGATAGHTRIALEGALPQIGRSK